jgi:two-component system sensor histidine kinase/response regulator
LGSKLGADDFINKPIDSETLLRLVNYYLEQRQSLQEEYRQRTSELEQSLTYALPHEFRTALNEILGVATHLKVFADRFSPESCANWALTWRGRLAASSGFQRTSCSMPGGLPGECSGASAAVAAVHHRRALRHRAGPRHHESREAQRGADVRLTIEATGVRLAMPSEHFAKIVEELLDNALKFSPPATPVLVRTWAAGDSFWVEIRDHGPGIPPELQKRIRAYYQPGRLLYEQQGIGLGLTLAKRLVELYKGQFELVTPTNGGTLVRFGLPLKQ